MYSLIIALAAGFGIAWITQQDLGPIWGLVCGLVTIMLVQLGIGLYIRRCIGRINNNIQQIMEAAQQKINRRIQMFQQKPGTNLKAAQQLLEKEQDAAVREALTATGAANRYIRWNLLLGKQINTMRMMLHFQLKEFDKVDALLPKCLLFDARSIAIKMVRMYKTGVGDTGKLYKAKTKRFKGEDMAFLASVYAYIQLKADNIDGAMATLAAAKVKTDNKVVLENWEKLANGKAKSFSNAGLGDLWYSLYLEEPKVRQQRVQQRHY